MTISTCNNGNDYDDDDYDDDDGDGDDDGGDDDYDHRGKHKHDYNIQ